MGIITKIYHTTTNHVKELSDVTITSQRIDYHALQMNNLSAQGKALLNQIKTYQYYKQNVSKRITLQIFITKLNIKLNSYLLMQKLCDQYKSHKRGAQQLQQPLQNTGSTSYLMHINRI